MATEKQRAAYTAVQAMMSFMKEREKAGGLKPVASNNVLSTADIYQMFQQGDARLGEPIGYL